MRPLRLLVVVGLAAALLAHGDATAAAQATIPSNSAAERRSLSLTIYSNYAMVRDTRYVDLNAGNTTIAFQDVSPQIDTQFAFFTQSGGDHPVWVNSQYYDAGGYSSGALMREAVGSQVLVITTDPRTGAQTSHRATLFSTDGPTLIFPDRVEVGLPPNSRLTYFSIPADLRAKPAFVADLGTTTPSRPALCLNYISDGLSWTTDYIAVLNSAEDSMHVDAVAGISNNTGVNFDDANLQLVGGSPQRLQAAMRSVSAAPMVLGHIATEYTVNPNNRASRQALLEYYLYTVPHNVSLGIGQTRSLTIFSNEAVPTTERYEVGGQEGGNVSNLAPDEIVDPVESFLQFLNQGKGIGIPLPPGVFHVFKRDASGAHQFVGEDQIDATPKNATVRLDVGKAFDISVKEIQTAFRAASVQTKTESLTEYFSAFRVTIANAKAKPVTVHLTESLTSDWKITRENFPHTVQSSGTVSWDIPVPANGSQSLEYSVTVEQSN